MYPALCKYFSGNVILVEYFASWCGHCKAFAPQYELTANALKGIVTVVAVENEQIRTEEGITGFPTIRLYLGKGFGMKEYKGPRTAEALSEFTLKEVSTLVMKKLKGQSQTKTEKKTTNKVSQSNVIELTEKNFDKLVTEDTENIWFVKFYAPWCGHCKALAGTWARLPLSVDSKVKIGKLDATEHSAISQRFKIQGYPTLLLFPSGKKAISSVIPYNGDREFQALVDFVSEYSVATKSIEQLVSNDQFSTDCQKKVCLIVFLPHILDSSITERVNYIKQLNNVVKASATKAIAFFWVQGGDSFEVEEALHLQFGYPAVIAVHLGKKKYTVHRGSFSTQAIRSFITGLTAGKQPLRDLPNNLPPFKTMNKWDSKQDDPNATKSRAEEL